MAHARSSGSRRAGAFALVLSAMALLMAGLGQRAANADHMTVTAVQGSAYGCFASVGLFGGPPNVRGPMPTATLPAGGSAVPVTGTSPTCNIIVGPANLFTAGPTNVSTQGTTGPAGSVTTTATLTTINTSDSEIFTASGLSSTCSASESGVTGSTTVTNGTIILQDPNPDTSGEAGEDIRTIPVNPAPNTTYEGTVANVNDNFRAVFNEQIVNPDGSLTVNAYHLYLLGPTAVGDLIAGQSICGVTTELLPTTTMAPTTSTTVAPNLPPVALPDTYSTQQGVPLVVAAPGVLANDTDPNGDPIIVGMNGQPSNGTLVINQNGSFTYTPNPGFVGTDTFTYMAHDPSDAMSGNTLVTINVTSAPTTTSTTLPPTTTSTTLPPTTTSTTLPPTTTSTTLPPPTTTSTTLPPPTTTSTTMPGTTTTTVPGDCVPGQDGAKPGYGKGDKNHVHCGPPGQGGQAPLNSRPVTSTRPLPVWLIAGLGALFLSSLVIPFRRMRGDHSSKR